MDRRQHQRASLALIGACGAGILGVLVIGDVKIVSDIPPWMVLVTVVWSAFFAGATAAGLWLDRLASKRISDRPADPERQAPLDRLEQWAEARPAAFKVALVLLPVMLAGIWAALG